jgi:DNA sulfur modification protein DndE
MQFNTIRTSSDNKLIVTDLTRKLNLGPENIIARLAFSISLSSNLKFQLSDIKDSKGKEYSKNVLFGNNLAFYVGLICIHYNIYKTDKDIPKYIKIHIDHGLELINNELTKNPNLNGFDYLLDKIDGGLSFIN